MKVSVAEAKNTLTKLIQRAESGERITICRHGKPVADLVPTAAEERKPRHFGTGSVVSRVSPNQFVGSGSSEPC